MTETGELSVVEAVSKVLAEIKPGSIDDNARAWRAVQAALDASEDRLRARISSLMSWSAAELGNSVLHRKIREHLGVGDDEYPWQTDVEAAQPDVVPQVLYDKGGQIMSLSMTFDNSSGYFEAAGPFFPPPQQTMRVQVDVPDGWWQTLKWRLICKREGHDWREWTTVGERANGITREACARCGAQATTKREVEEQP